jgi:hypothetical protein
MAKAISMTPEELQALIADGIAKAMAVQEAKGQPAAA